MSVCTCCLISWKDCRVSYTEVDGTEIDQTNVSITILSDLFAHDGD